MDDLDRFFALERRLLERLSTRVEPFEHGVAFFDEEYRDRFMSNFLLVEGPLPGAPAEALIEAADRILGGAGYGHRHIVVRDDHDGSTRADVRGFGQASARRRQKGKSVVVGEIPHHG